MASAYRMAVGGAAIKPNGTHRRAKGDRTHCRFKLHLNVQYFETKGRFQKK
jgi:hypothetical protein